jgi:CheY-like chemotaxis protein
MLGDREKAIASGCVDYIEKPVDSKRLLELVSPYLHG